MGSWVGVEAKGKAFHSTTARIEGIDVVEVDGVNKMNGRGRIFHPERRRDETSGGAPYLSS